MVSSPANMFFKVGVDVLAGTLRSAVEPRALASAASPYILVGILCCFRRRFSRNTIETGGPPVALGAALKCFAI